MVIVGVTDPDHPENFELAQAKGFGAHIEAQWTQFSQKYLNGRRSGRAVWTKLKEIKETYREVRTLHKETGNGGLLQIEDNDSKPKILKKLGTRLQKFESQAGKLKHVTSKEVYYTWVKGGSESWFARMHARYCDDMAIERPIERHNGRLSPLLRANTPNEAAAETDVDSKNAPPTTSDTPSTPSTRGAPPKKGGKRKASARSPETDDTDSAPSNPNKIFERLLDAIPPSVPPSIHERRITLEEKKLEMEDKRAEKNNYIADKRVQLEMQQFEEERERRKQRWEVDDEDRKRRRLIEDEDRERRQAIEDEDRERRRVEDKRRWAIEEAKQAAAQKQSQIKFLLEMASTTVGASADAFRQYALEIAKETFANRPSTNGDNSRFPSDDSHMEDHTRGG
ncbi:hypothetical protein BN14_11041 [Rhizoctonia solani AG-1 IB]|uniref:No apical meristem-associated C-terminal domain-containing protein n=1 Tax=Thanatephorus cucumeris (strain AG1-IB / isolate 7/3/14) TaxID=1108050 RepID=M5CC73_THACB|nr:hypothetical protein BN14_11041 [Rhizoctonia solani AG-1 IB]